MKQFTEAFDPLRSTLAEIDSLAKEAGGEFNEIQEQRAHDLTEKVGEDLNEALDKAFNALESLDKAREQRQAESDAREPIELPKSAIDPGVQARIDKITADATASLAESEANHADSVKTTGGPAGGVQTAATGNVVDNFVHGDSIELATSEGALQVHETGDGSRVISEEGEGLKLLTPDNGDNTGKSDAEKIIDEVFPEGSSRNEGWDKGFAGVDDPYGIQREYVDQSFNPNAAKTYTGSITADAPADAAAHIAGQQEVIRESHPEGDETAK